MQSNAQELVLVTKRGATWRICAGLTSPAMSPFLLTRESSVKNKDGGEEKEEGKREKSIEFQS